MDKDEKLHMKILEEEMKRVLTEHQEAIIRATMKRLREIRQEEKEESGEA